MRHQKIPAQGHRQRSKNAATAGFLGYFAYLLAAPYALPWYDAPAWGCWC